MSGDGLVVATGAGRGNLPPALAGYLDSRRQLVEEGIAGFLHRHYREPLRTVIGDVARGGKRLRGILSLLVCEALGEGPAPALAAAVAVELAHAASLVHDDLLDADVQRRGRPAFHVYHNVALAVLVPHLLVPHAVLSARPYGPAAIDVILEGWARVVEGQVADYLPLYPTTGSDGDGDTAAQYWSIVGQKTGALFEAAAALGALAAGDETHLAIVRQYGYRLGLAFQVADDVTDFEPHLHQPWAAVLQEGRGATARSLHLLGRLISGDGTGTAITLAAIAQARHLASGCARECATLAESLPVSPARELLRQFPAYAVAQIYAEQGVTEP